MTANPSRPRLIVFAAPSADADVRAPVVASCARWLFQNFAAGVAHSPLVFSVPPRAAEIETAGDLVAVLEPIARLLNASIVGLYLAGVRAAADYIEWPASDGNTGEGAFDDPPSAVAARRAFASRTTSAAGSTTGDLPSVVLWTKSWPMPPGDTASACWA